VTWYKPWTWGKVDDALPRSPSSRRPGGSSRRRGQGDPNFVAHPLDFLGHPGRRISVDKIFQAHDQAERGWPQKLVEIGRDRLKADGHLRSLVEQRRDDVARKEYVVLPGGEAEVDQAAAAELSRRLRRARGFRAALKHQEMSFWHGFSLTELVWTRADELFVPAEFVNHRHHRFVFDVEDEPYLLTIDNLRGEELRAGAWWQTRRDDDRAAVAGVAVTAILWSHLKSLGLRDLLRLSDRFGMPYVYGVYEAGSETEDNASDTDIAALKEAVQTLGKDGWAVFSNAAEIKIAEIASRGGGDIHSALMSACDMVNSKLIAGATTLNQTSGSTGSYAQSRVHADRGFNLLLGDAQDLSDSFERYVGEAFVHFNSSRFPGAQPPRLKFHLVQDQSPKARADVFGAAVKMGVPVSISQIRTELQLKPPTDDDDDIVQPPAPALPAADPDDDQPDEETTDEAE
jgi:phage gp29-like protein